jgi:hypothetical protein
LNSQYLNQHINLNRSKQQQQQQTPQLSTATTEKKSNRWSSNNTTTKPPTDQNESTYCSNLNANLNLKPTPNEPKSPNLASQRNSNQRWDTSSSSTVPQSPKSPKSPATNNSILGNVLIFCLSLFFIISFLNIAFCFHYIFICLRLNWV